MRTISATLLAVLVLGAATLVSACNTTAGLGQDVSARQLIGDLSVPLVGNQGTDEKHNKGNRRRQVGGRKNGPSHAAEAESSDGQFDPDTFPEL